MLDSPADAEFEIEREVNDRIGLAGEDLPGEFVACFCCSGNYEAVVSEVLLDLLDEGACRIRFADRHAMKPDHRAAIVDEILVFSKSFVKTGGVLLPPQDKKRRQKHKAEGEKDGVNEEHLKVWEVLPVKEVLEAAW